MRKAFLFLVFVISIQSIYSQEDIKLADSVIKVAKTSKDDSITIEILHKDFFKYCYSNPEVAKRLADVTINLSRNKQNGYLLVRSYLRRGIYYDVTGKKDSALIDYDKAHLIATKIDDKDAIASVYNNKGLVYWDRENFEEAMNYYLKSFKIFQEIEKPRGQASSLNNIGMLLFELDRLDESTKYHKKSLKIREEIKDSFGIGASYSNLSKNYTFLNKIDSAKYFSHKAIKIKKKTNDIRGLAIAYNNLGGDFDKLKQLDSALYYLKKADEIYKDFNSTRLRATNVQTLGSVYYELGDYNEAIKSYNIALDHLDVEELDSKYWANFTIAQSYFKLNNYKKASQYYQTAIELQDDIIAANDKIKTQEIFEKYQSAENEKEILNQRANLAEQSLTIQQRNYQIFGLLALAVILGFLGHLFYSQQKLKNRQLQKENELKDALAKIETQNRLQEQRLRISRDLHDNIGAQLTFIISSIDNLKYGFELPKMLNAKLNNISSFASSTIYELRDTIWAMNKNEITFEDLQSRISNFVDKANLVSENISFEFKAEENTKYHLKLSSIEGMNIYRVIQEAINNALKYAEATKIEVYFNTLKNILNIAIIDNGKGFDLKSVELGNGIDNMKKRAYNINAELYIQTLPKGGTTITLKKQLNT